MCHLCEREKALKKSLKNIIYKEFRIFSARMVGILLAGAVFKYFMN